jgi:uncharacterized phage protein (TIGR01671 family)
MREIKFRVWDKTSKRYAPISCVFGFLTTIHPDSKDTTCLIKSNSEYNIEQFTGLQDKNGKEIYEGDILELEGFKFIVIWDDKESRFAPAEVDNLGQYTIGSDYFGWPETGFIQSRIEIIGNINENKELIK